VIVASAIVFGEPMDRNTKLGATIAVSGADRDVSLGCNCTLVLLHVFKSETCHREMICEAVARL
jgi:hypothetical protein